jgi:hypothetical protein
MSTGSGAGIESPPKISGGVVAGADGPDDAKKVGVSRDDRRDFGLDGELVNY